MVIPIAGMALSGVVLYNTLYLDRNVDIQMEDSGKDLLRANIKDVNHLAILASGSSAWDSPMFGKRQVSSVRS